MEPPADADAGDLDPDVRRELQGLVAATADVVARHLVAVGQLLEDEPETALAHARAARALAGRVGAVREAAGLAAYRTGDYEEALRDLKAARRINGSSEHLAVIADSERGVGRPERALAMLDDPQAARLPAAARVELQIVASGARRDLGQPEAAVVLLQGKQLDSPTPQPWTARLRYAYAAALLEAGRRQDARTWFERAAQADPGEETDALEQAAALGSPPPEGQVDLEE